MLITNPEKCFAAAKIRHIVGEYALKSTEPSRDGSQCKARHRNMPGFVGLTTKKISRT